KIDDYFEYTADGTGFSNYDEGLKYDSSHPLLKETYRWGFEKRLHRENDTWDHLFDLAVALNTPSGPTYEQAVESAVDPQHFARVLAVRHAVGDWDSYGYHRGKNNYFYYALPEGRWYLLPWDIDFTLGSGDGPTTDLFAVSSGEFPEVNQFFNHYKYRTLCLRAFSDLVHGPWQTSYGTADPPTPFDQFLDDAANALFADGLGSGRRDGIKAFVRDRRAYILPLVPEPLVFEITTNSGEDFCTSASAPTIKGVASLEVVGISVNGEVMPAQFSGGNVFEVDVPIEMGPNLLNFQGLDTVGDPILTATDSVTITRVVACGIASVAPNTVSGADTVSLTIHGSSFEPGSPTWAALTKASDELGFDALYVQSDQAFDRIDAATLLLDDPERGLGDPVYAVHPWINLYNSGVGHGEFTENETSFAPPYDVDGTNYAVRFSGYIYAPSPGIRYFGVNSDDGFTLSIDGQLVGEYANSRPRGPATTDVIKNRTAGTMTFDFPAEGTYYLVLDYFENGGGEEIEFFQTNSTGGDLRLINIDAELIVFRDNDRRIDATNVVIVDTNTITCDVDLDGAVPGSWNLIVTPPCGEAATCGLDDAVKIIARSDFNSNSQVDFFDWAQLANHWLDSCSAPDWCEGTDLDQSGQVRTPDIRIFAQEWLLPGG
ncbi:MAG: CotH kinase family protein, partial [Phycisphaerales bacterium]